MTGALTGIIISFVLAAAFITAFVFVMYSIFKKKTRHSGCSGCSGCPMASDCEKRMEPDK